MSDYTLERGMDVVISGDTVIDDFIYQGGSIRLKPTVKFTMNGYFYFSPIDTDDPIGSIFNCILSRIAIETGTNGVFKGFHIYDHLPDNKPLYFPCVILEKDTTTDVVNELFGDEHIESLKMALDLAFKRTKLLKSEEGTLKERALAEYYLWELRKLLETIKFDSEYINISDFKNEATVVEPTEPKQTLYGFSMDLVAEFKKSAI